MTAHLQEYHALLRHSLLQVDASYFRLLTTYRRLGIVRERLFCYELYHQMRNLMTQHHILSLHGEIDKRGHTDFAQQHRRNPDFVFHIPGTHEGNLIVVEVKGELTKRNQVHKDFETLLVFASSYGYKSGVFILYNHTLGEFDEWFGAELSILAGHPSADDVNIFCIKRAGGPIDEALLSTFHV